MARKSRKCLLLWSNPRLAPAQPWGCCRARDIFGTPGHPPKRQVAPSPIDLGAIQECGDCTRQSGSQPFASHDSSPYLLCDNFKAGPQNTLRIRIARCNATGPGARENQRFLLARNLYRDPKKNPKAKKNARTTPKNCLNNSKGLPVITH